MRRGLLVFDCWEGYSSDCSRYSLDEARKCEESEALLLLGDRVQLSEGEAEWARRQAAAQFKKSDSRREDGHKVMGEDAHCGASQGAAMQNQ